MLLYDIGVRLYALAIRTAALRKSKAKQWVRGRKDWHNRLRQAVKDWNGDRIWVHCASYGELEQGRPLIEALRKKYPGHRLLLTFFSPSGYEPFRDWRGADAVFYLPLDTKSNSRDFLDIVNPRVAIFIKYEFWLNFLNEIRKREISCYLVSAVFKPHHPFFKWYGQIFRQSLTAFSTLYIQDEKSGELLKKIGIRNFRVAGDTRFDRVLQIRNETMRFGWLEQFKGNHDLIVAGSTWAGDETLVLDALAVLGSAKLLLVPHDVDEKSLSASIEKLDRSGFRYSIYSKGADPSSQILLLDTIGMLARTYAYADVAYIGGGFAGGLHNSLEAAVFGVPLTFYGTDYTKFNEAVELLTMGAAVNVRDAESLAAAWRRLLEPSQKALIGRVLEEYFSRNSNNTKEIVESIRI